MRKQAVPATGREKGASFYWCLFLREPCQTSTTYSMVTLLMWANFPSGGDNLREGLSRTPPGVRWGPHRWEQGQAVSITPSILKLVQSPARGPSGRSIRFRGCFLRPRGPSQSRWHVHRGEERSRGCIPWLTRQAALLKRLRAQTLTCGQAGEAERVAIQFRRGTEGLEGDREAMGTERRLLVQGPALPGMQKSHARALCKEALCIGCDSSGVSI